MGDPDRLKTTAVISVKRLDSAHGRLVGAVAEAERRKLAEAMFQDLLAKIRRCRTIDATLIVTADDAVARHADWLGHEVLKQVEDEGHSQAASAGARAAHGAGAERVVMLPTDCPLLDPAELDRHLGQSPRSILIVPDEQGSGTNALVICPPDAFVPAFGPDSCARHVARARASGTSFSLERIDSLALDLDTPEDMSALRDSLLLDPAPAPRTAQVLWELGVRAESPAAA
jgi:2-phospho-L-lactate guanylyltransferase